MKLCLACENRFESDGWLCPACGSGPAKRRGFLAFSPEPEAETESFREEDFARLAALEEGNFWFRSRNRFLAWALERTVPEARSLLEIGCGTGFVLSAFARSFPKLDLSGSEVVAAGLDFAARRVPQARLFQMDARRIPFDRELDVIGAFDVLEHVVEDERVLGELFRALRPGGGVLLTVPQHPFLWSRRDEVAHHVRRYRVGELEAKVRRAGFDVVIRTSFVALPLPLLALARLRVRKGEIDPMEELRMRGPLNDLLGRVLDLELALVRRGVRFPFGGSLLVTGRKRGSAG